MPTPKLPQEIIDLIIAASLSTDFERGINGDRFALKHYKAAVNNFIAVNAELKMTAILAMRGELQMLSSLKKPTFHDQEEWMGGRHKVNRYRISCDGCFHIARCQDLRRSLSKWLRDKLRVL